MERIVEKERLRHKIKSEFEAFASSGCRIEKSAVISGKIISQPFYENSKVVMAYMPLPDEVDITEVIHRAIGGSKIVVLPKCYNAEKAIRAHVVENIESGFSVGCFGVLEPDFGKIVSLDEIDVILIPGRAFDQKGVRLGRGGGYYDRFLSGNIKAKKVGISFDFQLFDDIVKNEHDVMMDCIITENRILNFKLL